MRKTAKELPAEPSAEARAIEKKAHTGESIPVPAKQLSRTYKIKFVDGKPMPNYDLSTVAGFRDMLVSCKQATGCNDILLSHDLIFETAKILGIDVEEKNLHKINGLIDTIRQMQPKDPLDAQLLCQMLSVHHVAQLSIQNALEAKSPELMEKYINVATKMHRTYTAQLEAFERRKRGGKQRIVIEHIQVNGGQNIIGSVAGGGGTGANGK